ncbi:uncharacterized protein LOC117651415 isoform X1 [Thrips palmi]|uniref:Uncharacterized protein LOC117651415 isoform X1 n=1 Tax=Thrips palmi TaxID=161013 RepID=A0A6P9A3S9_THRPL|nr:uncharacterized protein LOC117651415 isoform X1 [Thrips palmi]
MLEHSGRPLQTPFQAVPLFKSPLKEQILIITDLWKPTQLRQSNPPPNFPFLLWLSNDNTKGLIYLKIDQICILVARGEDPDFFIKAFDIFVKAHHVFNVKYHPYLRTTIFDYFLVSVWDKNTLAFHCPIFNCSHKHGRESF